MQNIKLTLAYDGFDFFGWQKASAGASIEETLHRTIEQILQEKVRLQAAGRTDAGVHARGQVVNFFTCKSNLNLSKLCLSINAVLPKSIVIIHAEFMPQAFHPTLDNSSKIYHYAVCLGNIQMPQHRFYSWHCPNALNIDAMRSAALQLIGEHDFAAFCNTKRTEPYESTVREVSRIEIIELEDKRLRFEVEGNHFLYKMVRNIVGTLVHVGRGKLKEEEIPDILKTGKRMYAGVTAPAHGLTLYKVNYILPMSSN